ncbi:MAG: NUDIX hydrolase [Gemmatimonadaceae bacterium]|nr:NUDIX hydrolase [Gemmatimonadaceae bacterium]
MADAGTPPPGRVATRLIHAGAFLTHSIDEVRFPDGSTGTLELITHPGASAVVPLLSDAASDDPQVLLVRQYRYATGGWLYEIPAGKLDDGDTPLACAHRELKEETGCTAAEMRHLTTFWTTPGFTNERIHIYLATGLTRGVATPMADEFLEVVTMPISRALAMVQSGEINDGKTVVGLLYAAGFALA